jgi:hypothetical protein
MKRCDPYERTPAPLSRFVQIVEDEKLETPAYLADLRAFTSKLGISPDDWLNFASDVLRDFNGFIRNKEGHLMSLNMEVLEVYREWYRDWVNTPVKPGVMPRLPSGSRPRIRVLATILRIAFPDQEAKWGNHSANDN